jgi:uncharacterized membrane protein required for colicin V production
VRLNLLDYAIILVVIAGGVSGYQRGLVRTVGNIVSLGLGLAIAALGAEKLTLYLEAKMHTVSSLAGYLENHFPLSMVGTADMVLPQSLLIMPQVSDSPYTPLAYVLVLAGSFLSLCLLVTVAALLTWAVLSWVLGWVVDGTLNRAGGAAVGVGLKTVGMAVLMGVLVPLVEVGANMHIAGALITRSYTQTSVLTPYLVVLFKWMTRWANLSL